MQPLFVVGGELAPSFSSSLLPLVQKCEGKKGAGTGAYFWSLYSIRTPRKAAHMYALSVFGGSGFFNLALFLLRLLRVLVIGATFEDLLDKGVPPHLRRVKYLRKDF
jgi:hypothetical protein